MFCKKIILSNLLKAEAAAVDYSARPEFRPLNKAKDLLLIRKFEGHFLKSSKYLTLP